MNNRFRPAALSCLFSLGLAATTAAAPLSVSSINPTEGQLLVRLYDTRIGYDTRAFLEELIVPVTGTTMTIDLPGVDTEELAITVYHDVNRNGKLDRSGIGIPREPIGYSLNPAVRMGRPTFDQTRFALGSPDGLAIGLTQPPAFTAKWGVGLGAVYSSSPYRDGDDAISPIPVVVYVGDKLVWFGPQARYVPLQNDLFAFSLSAEYQFGGDVFEESSFLADMEERENTLMAGAGISYEAPFEIDIDLDLRTDVLGRHDGQIASLDLGRSLRWPKVRISYGGGVTWNSSDYTGYFYGVRPGEARPDRPAYDPGDALIPFASLGLSWAPSDNWQLIISGTWEWLPNEITDSPLIAEDTQFSFISGLSYLF